MIRYPVLILVGLWFLVRVGGMVEAGERGLRVLKPASQSSLTFKQIWERKLNGYTGEK